MKKIMRFLCVLLSVATTAFTFSGCDFDFEAILDEILGEVLVEVLPDDFDDTENENGGDNNAQGGGNTDENGGTADETPNTPPEEPNTPAPPVEIQAGEFTEEDITQIIGSDHSIHFLEVGNEYTGDCTLIKAGDTEVLIDAGSRQNSAGTIVPYINEFCTDGVLEYVIATHAHRDHIAGFVGTTSADGVFESFVCETIIDYSLSNADSSIRDRYEELRDAEVRAGASHYTAIECVKERNGASKVYTLADGVTMEILYQEYYDHETNDENDYSVCVLLRENGNNYLFTGDLEGAGERSLLRYNPDLPRCTLFKAGHHGSPTSSSAELLAVIQPEIVTVCCCCGSDEYTDNVENQFPSQAFVDRVSQYTEKVYVTTIIADNEDGFASMNGNIVLTVTDGEFGLRCSNNATLFKDTEWFRENRILPDAWTTD